eukprot:7502229-Ditylum_brightwellii.AAC.1
MAFASYTRSEAGYREQKILSPLELPSVSTLKKMCSKNKLNDGICPKVYENRRKNRGENVPIEYAILMADEMKLKHGIMWSTQSLEPVGLTGDLTGSKTIIKKIILADDDDDVPEPAQYVCQWKYKKIVTKDTFKR